MSDQITNETYDRIASSFAERYWNIVLERAIDRFTTSVKSGGRVLELGCGPGRDVALLRRRGFDVIGSDRSTGMLKEAQRRVGGTLVCADMRDLPFAGALLSGIWMCASLLHIPRLEVPNVLAEVRRVLHDEGVLYISVQEGEGEGWTESDGGRRFFTYFGVEEIQSILAHVGFSVKEYWTDPGAHHAWISVLAVRR